MFKLDPLKLKLEIKLDSKNVFNVEHSYLPDPVGPIRRMLLFSSSTLSSSIASILFPLESLAGLFSKAAESQLKSMIGNKVFKCPPNTVLYAICIYSEDNSEDQLQVHDIN